ncbi:MAG TPA: hypothetical protein VL793_10005, partial [Patescibacteria group bacterium]|nr:hypothetical protein [Patescibacteria group bacterium]
MGTADGEIQADERGLIVICPNCGRKNRAIYERLGDSFRCGACHLKLPAANQPVEVQTDAIFEALTRAVSLPVL